jgi:hypothetical protein
MKKLKLQPGDSPASKVDMHAKFGGSVLRCEQRKTQEATQHPRLILDTGLPIVWEDRRLFLAADFYLDRFLSPQLVAFLLTR